MRLQENSVNGVVSSVLLFSVISFKQKRLWGWLALVFIATLGMSGWLKWQTVIILITNQTIVTLYCVKVVVSILVTSTYP